MCFKRESAAHHQVRLKVHNIWFDCVEDAATLWADIPGQSEAKPIVHHPTPTTETVNRHWLTLVHLDAYRRRTLRARRHDVNIVTAFDEPGSQALRKLCRTVDVGAKRVASNQDGQLLVRAR
jgi:hypothetical protein